MVAVFDEAARSIRSACAKIHGQHGFDPRQPAPVDELVGAESIRLGGQPRQIQAARAILDGADAVLPVVTGDEVAARVTHDGRRKLAHEREHVVPESMSICTGVTRLENAAVYAAPQMLDDGAEQAAIS